MRSMSLNGLGELSDSEVGFEGLPGASASASYTAAAVAYQSHSHTFHLSANGSCTPSPLLFPDGAAGSSTGLSATEVVSIEHFPEAGETNLSGTAGRVRFKIRFTGNSSAASAQVNCSASFGFSTSPFYTFVGDSYQEKNTTVDGVFLTDFYDFTFHQPQGLLMTLSMYLNLGLYGSGSSAGSFSMSWVGTEVYDAQGNRLDSSKFALVAAPGAGGVGGGVPQKLSPVPEPLPNPRIVQTVQGVEIHWPARDNDLSLESSADLSPSSWTSIAGPFSVVGDDLVFQCELQPGERARFFRLRR